MTPSDIVNPVNPLQLRNALVLISSTLAGIIKFPVNPLQLENAPSPISVTLAGIVNPFNSIQ
jgi:hypothetical protein